MNKSKEESEIAAAWFIAENAHLHQKYDDEPYINHVKRVHQRVVRYVSNPVVSHLAGIVAILHDAVEDSDVSLDEIEEVFGKKVRISVYYITRRNSENYCEYIHRVSENGISRLVKICDILENMSNCYGRSLENTGLIQRYEKALLQLASH